MTQKILWMPVQAYGMGYRATIEYSGPVPKYVWTLFLETEETKVPVLPISPVHHQNAFFEDRLHDWYIRGGVFHYCSRAVERPVWILLEF